MTDFNSNRITTRRPSRSTQIEGYSPRIPTVSTPPPGPWQTGPFEYTSFSELEETGCLLAYEVNYTGYRYAQLYVYVSEAPEPGWKKVDLNWPKIDPRTGKPFNQYTGWHSPLAE